MIDREKVINQFEADVKKAERTGEMFVYVGRKTATDVIALLKEQKPVKPEFDATNPDVIGTFFCGNCHCSLGFIHPRYCPFCGRPVKWNG